MKEKITKEEAEKIMSLKGEVRGMTLKTDESFVIKYFGKDALQKVEKRLEELGYPLNYKEVAPMDYYPLGMRALSLIAIKETLELSDEKMREMGRAAPRASLLIRFFMKYFISIEKTFKKAGDMWDKHWTVGKLESVDVREKERRVVLHLSGIDLHPEFCNYFTGYLSSVGKLATQKETHVEETKCTFKGDDLHEFILTW